METGGRIRSDHMRFISSTKEGVTIENDAGVLEFHPYDQNYNPFTSPLNHPENLKAVSEIEAIIERKA
jgi:hypothetical protein